MRGTEVGTAASNAEDQSERDGETGVLGGVEPVRADDIGVGEDGSSTVGSAPAGAGERRARPVYSIYALVDPRNGCVFYIGFTGNHPRYRLSEHRNCKQSAAYDTIHAIEDAGGAVGMRVLAVYEDRNDALAAEYRYITSTPGLVNRQSYSSEWFPREFEDTSSTEPDLDFVAYEEDMGQRMRLAKESLKTVGTPR